MTLLIDQLPEGAEIGAEQLRAYLLTAGWSLVRADADAASELWEAAGAGRRRTQVVLPVDPSFIDYRRRLSDSLQRLCEVYDWDLQQLLRSVQAIRSDLILIHADQVTKLDSIPLRQAEELIQGAIQMLQSAAWSTVSPRASLRGRMPNAVKQFLDDDLRMGHTQRGSFVLTILARVDDEPVEVESVYRVADEDTMGALHDRPADQAASELDHGGVPEQTRFILPPFQRRVMATLASALTETKALTESGFLTSRMEVSVGRGVSAQLCESLSEMTRYEGLRSLDISFQWAPLPAFEAPAIRSVSITRDNIGELDSLKERFRARETRRQARIEVSGKLHEIAIRSYQRQRSIAVTGELRREVSGYWLRGEVSVVE